MSAVGTLLGAFLGALLGAVGAYYVSNRSFKKSITENEKREDFEFRKNYLKFRNHIDSIIKRIDYVIDGKMEKERYLKANLEVVEKTLLQFDRFPTSLITLRKYDDFMLCYNKILDFQAVLQAKLDGIYDI